MFEKLKILGRSLKKEIQVYRLVLKNPQTPRVAKALLWIAVGYTLMPFDFIPDFIPVVGHLDDLIIIPLLLYAAIKMIPQKVIEDCRKAIQTKDNN